jgi:hypothetical protein
MGMRETARSLRAYFIVVGLLSGVPNVLALLAEPMGLGTVFSLAAVGLAVAYLYLGIRLKVLLLTAPGQITTVILAGGALIIVALIISLLAGSAPGLIQAVIGLLITWYLYTNVRRLASESAANAASSPNS